VTVRHLIVKVTAKNAFGTRLKQAFGNATNKIIGEKIGVAENTVGFYVRGRIPDAEILIKIANVTNRSIDWLLTGDEKEQTQPDPLINEHVLRSMVRRIIHEEMQGRLQIQDLGSVDAFDLDAAIGRGESDGEILSGWYESEGRHLPDGFLGVLPKLEPPITAEKRRSLLKDLKKMLDLKLAGNQ